MCTILIKTYTDDNLANSCPFLLQIFLFAGCKKLTTALDVLSTLRAREMFIFESCSEATSAHWTECTAV